MAFEARLLGGIDFAARVTVNQIVFDGEKLLKQRIVSKVAGFKLFLLGRRQLAEQLSGNELRIVVLFCHWPSALCAKYR